MTEPVMSVRRTTLIASALVALGPTSMALYTPAMPELVRAFDTTPGVVKATLTAYFAGFAFSQLVAGPFADAFGRRSSTLIFIAIYILGSLGAVLASSVDILMAARLVQGIGAAIGVTVSRAIVRDLYPGDRGARILNLVGIILAIAPATSPAIGGVMIGLAGWYSVFVMMAIFGFAIAAIGLFALRETIVPDLSRLRPLKIARAYGQLLSNAEFMTASIAVACGVGIFYTLATILPFVLIDVVGLTPTEFGFAMLFQTGAFMTGSVVFRLLMRWLTPRQAVLPGFTLILTGSVAIAIVPNLVGPALFTVMIPVSFCSFGVAMMMPFMLMAGMRPFPHIAGQAAAMAGFFQIGSGFAGGVIGALIGDPVRSITTVIPAMGVTSFVTYFLFCRATARAQRVEDESQRAQEQFPAPAA